MYALFFVDLLFFQPLLEKAVPLTCIYCIITSNGKLHIDVSSILAGDTKSKTSPLLGFFSFCVDRSDILQACGIARGGLRKFRATARNYLWTHCGHPYTFLCLNKLCFCGTRITEVLQKKHLRECLLI